MCELYGWTSCLCVILTCVWEDDVLVRRTMCVCYEHVTCVSASESVDGSLCVCVSDVHMCI